MAIPLHQGNTLLLTKAILVSSPRQYLPSNPYRHNSTASPRQLNLTKATQPPHHAIPLHQGNTLLLTKAILVSSPRQYLPSNPYRHNSTASPWQYLSTKAILTSSPRQYNIHLLTKAILTSSPRQYSPPHQGNIISTSLPRQYLLPHQGTIISTSSPRQYSPPHQGNTHLLTKAL